MNYSNWSIVHNNGKYICTYKDVVMAEMSVEGDKLVVENLTSGCLYNGTTEVCQSINTTARNITDGLYIVSYRIREDEVMLTVNEERIGCIAQIDKGFKIIVDDHRFETIIDEVWCETDDAATTFYALSECCGQIKFKEERRD